MDKNSKKTELINKMRQRYSACSDAVSIIDAMMSMNVVLKRFVKKIYPDDAASKELADSCTTIRHDLVSMKDEISDVALEWAEDIQKEERKGE